MPPTSGFEMHGEIDAESATRFEDAIRSWLGSGGLPILDMTGVTFIDSTGLNMLVRVSEHHDQPLTLQGMKPPICAPMEGSPHPTATMSRVDIVCREATY
jgi:anti-anti-sigma factor